QASQAQIFRGGTRFAYTVTAARGAAPKNWTVTVSEKLSADKEITAFTLTDNQIGNAIINTASATVTLVVPSATDLNNITPVNISLSAYATINPLPNVARNFSSAVTYTVTAQDGSTKLWTVNTTTPDALFTSYEAEEASFTGTVDNNHTGFTGSGFINFLSGGENQIVFTICQTAAGSRTAQFRYALQPAEARPGKLFVNDIEVATLPFASTGAWNTWANETITLALEAGINNIKITWNETDGPNLDKLMLNGAPCNTYPVTVNATNGGTVTLSPQRPGNRYFEGETLTLLANSTPSLQFTGWQGSISGTANPIQLTITEAKNITAQFEVVPTYTLTVNVTGVGQVLRSPQATEYPAGSTVTLTANTLLGSNFIGWSGQASGAQPSIQVLMDGNKTINAAFTSTTSLNFNNPVGFASVNTGSTYPDFNSAVTGGQGSTDTLWVNGPADFDSLAWKLYYRNRAYRLGTTQ
ncbi:MAG TPA: DUF5018 domain-containing protein, partial [Phnomibacter sp.]|nr:DUF5018 domain-containing protein [Phnomibacter sp.]